MNYQIARKLLIDQTETARDTVLNRLQKGKLPIPGQITSILLALKLVFESLKDVNTIDKELAWSLHKLGSKCLEILTMELKSDTEWPPLLKEDLQRITLAVESIFSGTWETKK
ncbi:Dethiobiotin synthetase [Cylindrospermopsis raciborskii]|uniref:Dethiobiotin synthetase n=1 Tax=Cylindrospermopsis raciborskii TaxID=77022 RepID=UPI000E1F62A1|nr:Dethiobiotin synthetase [Cylindrospermopsis raciborskii]TPX28095.1 Dethiobiotin synthetase [Cylindrospermopsis raciborskii GIHE 2018]UJL34602.1 Dethiobiotin synthetase [Cylindrospermopsis raciborskii Cr2010]UJS04122.1 Dethiobiotin synthetase [Cylindrospermopsis raciborskii KLL07]